MTVDTEVPLRRYDRSPLMITSVLKSGSLRPVISEFLTPDRWQVARRCG
jgi:hypothetical protein